MQINPKSVEQISRVGVDLKKVATEAVNPTQMEEVTKMELPRMSLESVMPKSNIIKSAERFNIEKAIEDFTDINDTKTIEKICKEWQKDIDAMGKKFLSGKLPQEGLYEEHQESLEAFKKYDAFSDKIFNAVSDPNGDPTKAMAVFEKYIEPIIMNAQEMFRAVDNIPEVKQAYIKAVEDSTKSVLDAAAKEAPKAAEKVIKTAPKAIHTNTVVTDEILENIKNATSINDASKIIYQIEAKKDSLSMDEYEELSNLIITKMQTLQ